MSTILDIKLMSEKFHQLSEAIKTLRTNILFCGMDIKCIALTSSIPNEGKSAVSLELAASLAKIDKRVLFIDADMRKSVLKRRHKLPTVSGLSQYLTAQAELDEVICQTQLPNLDIILCGFYPPNPVELLSSERFTQLIDEMKEAYDFVIIDTPPLGIVIDAAIISKISDGAVIVVGTNMVSAKLAQSVRDQLLKADCKILGAIMNFCNSSSGSQYNYKYKYEYKHKKEDEVTEEK